MSGMFFQKFVCTQDRRSHLAIKLLDSTTKVHLKFTTDIYEPLFCDYSYNFHYFRLNEIQIWWKLCCALKNTFYFISFNSVKS